MLSRERVAEIKQKIDKLSDIQKHELSTTTSKIAGTQFLKKMDFSVDTEKELKAVYKNISMNFHPDKQNGDGTYFKILSNCYNAARSEQKETVFEEDMETNDFNEEMRAWARERAEAFREAWEREREKRDAREKLFQTLKRSLIDATKDENEIKKLLNQIPDFEFFAKLRLPIERSLFKNAESIHKDNPEAQEKYSIEILKNIYHYIIADNDTSERIFRNASDCYEFIKLIDNTFDEKMKPSITQSLVQRMLSNNDTFNRFTRSSNQSTDPDIGNTGFNGLLRTLPKEDGLRFLDATLNDPVKTKMIFASYHSFKFIQSELPLQYRQQIYQHILNDPKEFKRIFTDDKALHVLKIGITDDKELHDKMVKQYHETAKPEMLFSTRPRRGPANQFTTANPPRVRKP